MYLAKHCLWTSGSVSSHWRSSFSAGPRRGSSGLLK